ncbi:MAG: IPTL-CTERM sorting domain-containing protein, partial [Planctomycetota bacterium]|nr:IPTL-CTERM sorting domain-containing protein [Planctomycetota bacterium]
TIGNIVYPIGTVVIGNNGGVGFGSIPFQNLPPLNEPIPSSSAFGGGQAMLAFWDDIDDKCGDVYFEQRGDRLIVQWEDRPLGSDPQQHVTFQLQVLENPNVAGLMAQLIFADIEQPAAGGGISATIGYQDGGAGYGDLQWSFNTSGAVSNGTALSFVVMDPMPTVSEWGLIILMLLLTTAGTLVFRRRRYRVSA